MVSTSNEMLAPSIKIICCLDNVTKVGGQTCNCLSVTHMWITVLLLQFMDIFKTKHNPEMCQHEVKRRRSVPEFATT